MPSSWVHIFVLVFVALAVKAVFAVNAKRNQAVLIKSCCRRGRRD